VLARVNFACIFGCAIVSLSMAARAQDIEISGAAVYTAPHEAPLRKGTGTIACRACPSAEYAVEVSTIRKSFTTC
jgi:hypothetical protein